MSLYSFEAKLSTSEYGVGRVASALRSTISGIDDVRIATMSEQRLGIDYVARTRRGAEINIDLKSRERGCGRWWKDGPEVALEVWSVTPSQYELVGRGLKLDRSGDGRVGWTLDESKHTHYTLHTFDSVDCDTCYVLPFQLLRSVFKDRLFDWSRTYKVGDQESIGTAGTWGSQCVFVPVGVVLRELTGAMEVAA